MWGYRNDSREGSFFCDAIIEKSTCPIIVQVHVKLGKTDKSNKVTCSLKISDLINFMLSW